MAIKLHMHPEEHNTYEEGIHLDAKDKWILASIISGLAFLMLLILIGIGF